MANEKTDHFGVAKIVLYGGLGSVAILGGLAITFSVIYGEKTEVFTSVKDILTLLLPVIGAWVGTILAYYFAKDNFKAATESSKDMFKEVMTSTKDKLKSIFAKTAMIKIEDADIYTIKKKESEITLKSVLLDFLDKKKRNRLPVLDTNGIAKYMIHRSIIDKFIVKSTDGVKELDDLTLQDMLDDEGTKEMIRDSFRTINESATLLDAKEYIDGIEICLDVFVTKTGNIDSQVIGWITNTIVTKESNV